MGMETARPTEAKARASSALVPALLSHGERVMLSWVCGALFPRLEPRGDDDPQLFGADALTVGVPAAIEEALATVPARQSHDLRRLLRALDNPMFVLALVGKPRSFKALTAPDREKALLAMATSSIPVLRQGFQALKRLASFLFYAAMDERRSNPTWRGIGYVPSENPPARPAALRLTHIRAPAMLECDVCVVGSGAGGSVVAAVLARKGLRVVVIEQGAGDQAPDYDQRESVAMQRLFLDRGMTTTRDLAVSILAGACVGGGTTVNWQTSLRLPDDVRDEWAEASGARFFTEPSFSESLDAVCERSSVGPAESEINANNEILRRGCEALGWRWHVSARNARGCDTRQCGYCVYGCRHGGKQSTAVTFLADAQQDGDTTIVPNCRALEITRAASRVTGVRAVVRDADSSMGTEYKMEVRARLVVAAAGALETPALLLRSGIELPAVGRNLYLHPTTAVAGVYGGDVRTWTGAPQTILSDEHASLDGPYGFRLETAPAHPGLHALALPWFGARDHRQHMQRVARAGSIIVLTRDHETGRVRIRRDGRARIDYRPGARELSHLKRGLVAAIRAHLAAGADEVLTLHSRPHRLVRAGADDGTVTELCDRILRDALDRNWSTLFSAHQMGTCAIGTDTRRSVCDEDGRVHGTDGLYVADASLFPLSSGVNPMITVMAIAHHIAVGLPV